MIHTLVPLKTQAQAKQRLAGLFAPAERAELAEAMARDVLDAIVAVPGLARQTRVLGSDPAAAQLAAAYGLGFIEEPGGIGLNAALELARANVIDEGGLNLLILHGDLPLANAGALETLMAAHSKYRGGSGISLVSDRFGTGTKGLLMSPADALPMVFGADSSMQFETEARRCGLGCNRIDVPDLQLDINRPQDVLEWLARLEDQTADRSGHSASLLGRMNVAARLTAGLDCLNGKL